MIDAILKSLACLPVMPVYPSHERPVYLNKAKAEQQVARQDRVDISAEAKARYAASLAESSSDGAAITEPESTETRSSPKQETQLTEAEKREVAQLQKRDTEVRTHEQAHLAASGGMAAGGPSYEYETGPDGKKYAVGGEVPISSKSGSTPQERLANAEKVRRAALAPASPSSEDRSIAAQAAADAAQARAEMAQAEQSGPATDTANAAANISQIAKPATEVLWQKAVSAYQKQIGADVSPAQKYASSASNIVSRLVDVSA